MERAANRRVGPVRIALILSILSAGLVVEPAAAQGFPVCAVASVESIGDLQSGGAYVVATSIDTTRANALCDMLVNFGGYSQVAIPSVGNTQFVAGVASSAVNPIQISVLANVDTEGTTDAPSDQHVFDVVRAKAAAFDIQTALPGVVLKAV
jgi:hypothetical protein